MCAQCMAGAATAAVAVTGSRAWLATKVNRRALKALTALLIVAGLLAASLLVG